MTKAIRLYQIARQESESDKWKRLLNTVDRRVRFEDGFVQGWVMAEKEMRKKMRKKAERE